MAPSPKPPGQRVRRNKDQPTWKLLPSARPFTVPEAPDHWCEETREWWRLVWESPMATLYIESDVPNLRHLGELMEMPKKSAEHIGEIRQMRSQYGLTPAARKSLMWHIQADEAVDQESPVTVSNVRRLRAV